MCELEELNHNGDDATVYKHIQMRIDADKVILDVLRSTEEGLTSLEDHNSFADRSSSRKYTPFRGDSSRLKS